MTAQLLVASCFGVAGLSSVGAAVWNERRMQRHRQPGVGYARVTLRRDGGWRRADLFTPDGLAHQARASRFALAGVVCWVLALAAWVVLGA